MKVKFKRFSSRAKIPEKATEGSACYDLFAARCVVLEPKSTRSVETDLEFSFSKKYNARIYPRSRLSLIPIHIGGGTIDSDYRGNVRGIMTNSSEKRIEFETGDSIAQIDFVNKEDVEFEEVSFNEFNKTSRGNREFGSTGK